MRPAPDARPAPGARVHTSPLHRAAKALSLALLLAAPRHAPAASVRLVDTLVLEWRGDNDNGLQDDDDYGLALTKLYVSGEAEDTSVRAQIDGVLFNAYPDGDGTPDSPSAFRDDARLERLSVKQPIGDVTLTLGDHPKQLGRGLALSLRKVDELGIDQALRGGTVAYEGEHLSGSVFAGRTNVANLDGVTQRFVEDPADTLAGGNASLRLGRAELSAHGLFLQSREPTLPELGEDRTLLGGGFLEVPAFDWATLYVEGATEQYTLAGKTAPGHGAYGALDLDLQLASLLLEGLWLDRFQVLGSYDTVLRRRTPYNQPPTLERIDQEVLDSEDVQGGRAKLSRSFFDGALLVYGNALFRRYGPEAARVDALHGYGGFELAYGGGRSRWNASGGVREERQDDAPFKSMTHGETDWVQELGAGFATHLTVAHEERTLLERDYVRGTTLAGLEYAGLGSLAAELGYDTFRADTRQRFVAGHLVIEASEWLLVRAVVGSQRGGIKCVGGICRDFPAFSGARLEASVQTDLL